MIVVNNWVSELRSRYIILVSSLRKSPLPLFSKEGQE